MQLDAQMCDMLVKCSNFAFEVHIMYISFYNSIYIYIYIYIYMCVAYCYVCNHDLIQLHILHIMVCIMLLLVHSARGTSIQTVQPLMSIMER